MSGFITIGNDGQTAIESFNPDGSCRSTMVLGQDMQIWNGSLRINSGGLYLGYASIAADGSTSFANGSAAFDASGNLVAQGGSFLEIDGTSLNLGYASIAADGSASFGAGNLTIDDVGVLFSTGQATFASGGASINSDGSAGFVSQDGGSTFSINLNADGSVLLGSGGLYIDTYGTLTLGNFNTGYAGIVLNNADSSASFAQGAALINPDGSASFGSGSFLFNTDGTINLGSVTTDTDGNLYVHGNYIPSIVDGLAQIGDNISEFNNDVGYITSAEALTLNATYGNYADFIGSNGEFQLGGYYGLVRASGDYSYLTYGNGNISFGADGSAWFGGGAGFDNSGNLYCNNPVVSDSGSTPTNRISVVVGGVSYDLLAIPTV
jgi:hypothetical protein